MKLTGLLILIATLHAGARGMAQTVTLQAKGEPLVKVLMEIKKQTGLVFFYDEQAMEGTRAVTVQLKAAPVKEALDQVLSGQPVTYDIEGNTVSLIRKEKAVASATAPLGGNDPVVVVVQTEAGVPLEGATVYIPKLNRSGMTDFKGKLELKQVPNGEYLVEVTNVGFEKHIGTLKVSSGEARLEVRMKQAVGGLDETVVKGYYTTSRALNTGNVTTVKGEDIQKQPVSDPIQALEGRVPGMIIQQSSGVPGAYAKIQIRGQNSIANGSDPLYIIDGVPFSSLSLSSAFATIGMTGASKPLSNLTGSGLSPFNALNLSDIENIEVLKDADATAIYGSRGANGVILITTRKGKSGDTQFDLNVFTGAGTVPHKLHLLDTHQYLAMRRQAFLNDSVAIPSIATNPYDFNYDIDGAWDTTRYTDWQKMLIGGTANFTNAQGILSGGNAYTRFNLGGGYSRQGTIFPGNYADQKASIHVNITHNSVDHRFGAQFVTSYVNDNNNLPANNLVGSITLAPDAPPLYDKQGNLNWQMVSGSSTFQNPMSNLLQTASGVTQNLISNLSLRYQLLQGLELKSSFGYNHDVLNQMLLTPATAVSPPYNTNTGRDNTFARTDFSSWIIEPQISFGKWIGRGRLDILTGTSFQENKTSSLTQDANNFVSDALISNPQAAASVSIFGSNYSLYRYTAIYGRIGYNWQDKYIVNLTARRDGSSRFGPKKQFGNFGAVGLAWIFSKERFVQKRLPFLNFGKIRGSYGVTGNDQIPDYQFLSTYTSAATTYQGITSLSPARLTNPFFAWEVVNKLEGGIEIGLLKDSRIFISASYFRNRTGNQLVGLSLPSQTGFNTIQYNLPAVVQNTGLELILNTENIHSKKFEWSTSVNLTIPDNKLMSFPNLANFTAYKNTYVVGQSLFIRQVYQNTGVDPQTGLYAYTTKNASGLPSSPQDRVPTKPVTQRLYGGVENRFSYKGFSLDFFVQFVNQITQSYIKGFAPPGTANNNEPTVVLGRWQTPGNLTAIERFGSDYGAIANRYSFLGGSDKQFVNGNFIRLKSLSFSYQLPNAWKSALHLHNARVYIQGQNLLIITNYLGMDPETGVLSLPPLRMIVAGLQVGL